MSDLYQLTAAAVAEHRPQMGLLLHGRLLCTCSGEFDDTDDWAAHVAQAVGDMLIDLAGTGRLLASIDRIARPSEWETT